MALRGKHLADDKPWMLYGRCSADGPYQASMPLTHHNPLKTAATNYFFKSAKIFHCIITISIKFMVS